MDKITLKNVAHQDIALYRTVMVKERIDIRDDYKCQYIGAFLGTELVGFVGFRLIGKAMRMKTDYVISQHRGKGVYRKLFMQREIATSEYPIHTAFSTPMSLPMFLKAGYKIMSERNGINFVKKYEKL